MNYGREHMLEGLCGLKFDSTTQKSLTSIFTNICETLHKEPKFIAHRDYHSRNVMIKHGKVRVIDFQDARMGSIQYDLVSLLRDSYVNLSDQSVATLLDYYLERRKEKSAEFGLPAISRDHFDHIFEIQTIQRCFKACGSFASFKMLRHDNRYLKYLTPTLKTVRRSLAAFPEYATFFRILEDNGVFEKTFEVS
jgi:aminoglycoside/choline kinase family phosphotransferase